jgi:hypothetical protein
VKYRSTLSANSNGQNATIGFQSAGGASATASAHVQRQDPRRQPAELGLVDRAAADLRQQHRRDEGSVRPRRRERRRDVVLHVDVRLPRLGSTCRSSAGVCDVAETCTGSSATCPADVFSTSATVCRSAAGVCDLAENCTARRRLSQRRRSPSSFVCRSSQHL